MLQGINIFDFFTNINSRRWNNADIREYCVIFKTGFVPPFIVINKTNEIIATVSLINEDTKETVDTYNIDLIDSGDSGYKILPFIQKELPNKDCGYYYFKVKIGNNEYYSEVFGWMDNVSKLVKFDIYSENVTFANEHELPYKSILNKFYLFYNGDSINSEISEIGVEKPYGDIPLFSTLNILRTLNINGTKQIFRYLSSLRILHINGIINITINGEKRQIYDIRCEVESDDSFGICMQVNFIYKELDFISVRNEI